MLSASSSVEAEVPGCVHTDLLRNGLIPDPYLEDNENSLQWIGRTDWEYLCVFDHPGSSAADRIELVFDGIDAVAQVNLNGTHLGNTANQHRTYRFDVSNQLRSGTNELRVVFAAPVTHVETKRAERGNWPHTNHHPFNQIRKMACNFGWDWGPDLATSGLWRPVWLETWSTARLGSVSPRVSVVGRTGRVEVELSVENLTEVSNLTVRVHLGDVEVSKALGPESAATLELEIPGVDLWWPHSLGTQPLYPLMVVLESGGSILDRWERRIGFRTVTLDNSADAIGAKWELSVNGTPLWVRGANWIPDDCFPARVDSERYRARLSQAVDANIDLLRVWGGGAFESDDFYNACDEMGLLVWQDFPFACATYPEDDETAVEVEAEARDNVTRLLPHPSLILWNGNNENQWLLELRFWDEELDGRPWGDGFYSDLLPRVVAEIDGTRPYWPGSPYSDETRFPNDEDYGNTHIWDVWNEVGYLAYRQHRPRFVSEFGFQGPPTMATLRQAIQADQLSVDSPMLWHHQKARDGELKLTRGLAEHFPIPADFDDWHFLTSVNQARAIQLALEHFRGLGSRCSGAIVWQLNDCWPVISWAMVDGYGRLKPVWYAVQAAFASRHGSILPEGGTLRFHLSNLEDSTWRPTVRFRRVSLAGEMLADDTTTLEVEPQGSLDWTIPPTLSQPEDPTAELLVVDGDIDRRCWFWVPDKDLTYPAARFTAEAEPTADGARVTVTAGGLVRDLCLLADRVQPEAVVDRALVTLLAGESVTFDITNAPGIDLDPVTSSEVLRCVNAVPELVTD